MLRRFLAVMFVPLATVLASGAGIAALAGSVPTTQVVPATQLTAVANRAAHALVTDPDRLVTPAYQMWDQHVQPGTLTVTAGTPQVNATYLVIPLQIAVNGTVVKVMVAGYRVQQYVHTSVAAHDLQAGTILTKDDLAVARVLSNGRPPVDFDALVGRKIRAATTRGSLIYPEQTMVNELVKIGQGAILIIRDGPVALTADVVARTAGGMGDTVTVYNSQTNKILSGVVTGPAQVELDLPGGDAE